MPLAYFLPRAQICTAFSGERSWLAAECSACVGVRKHYENFRQALLLHAREFEKPLYDGDGLVEHFTRVEGFGEDTIRWVSIVICPETSQVFEIHQEIIPENTGEAGK
jgi:hypothetical protein